MVSRTTRAQNLAKRFAAGTKVIVGGHVPNKTEWPGVQENMLQFFCGEELEVIEIVSHPEDSSRLAVVLNTKDMGAKKNFLFSTDWLKVAGEDKLEVLLAPVYIQSKARKTKKDVDINVIAEIRDRVRKELAKNEKAKEVPASGPDPVRKVEERKPEKVEFGWGAALGGALVTALGAAVVKKKLEQSRATEQRPEPETVTEKVEVAQEVSITV